MKKYEFSVFDYDWEWDDTKRVLRVTECKQTSKEWVNKMVDCALNLDTAVDVGSVGRYTYAYDDTGRVARACCADGDEFDRNTGIAIAYARLRNLPIHPAFQSFHPASEATSTTHGRLRSLQERDIVKPGSRVRSKSTGQWGTITHFAFASQDLVTVKWDQCQYDYPTLKTALQLLTNGGKEE